jgi:predicted ferric reductase
MKLILLKLKPSTNYKMETYERRFQTQKAMVDSLLDELEAANIKIRELKNESYHLEA